MMSAVEIFLRRLQGFEKDAHAILGQHEASNSRVFLLEVTYKKLGVLSLAQDEMIRQSLRCVENGLFRAAHVMAWSGFIDFLEEKLGSDGFLKLRATRVNWKFKTVEDLREQNTEYTIIEAAKEVGLCTKTEMKSLHGLLNKRNECAHPSGYFPDLNEALGYISELLKRIDTLMKRTL
jgi:hypothetical protein